MINPNYLEIMNQPTQVFQSSMLVSLRLPIINLMNTSNEKYFIRKIEDMGLIIVHKNNSVIIVEKVLKTRKKEENVITLTPKDEWYIDEKFLLSSSIELLKFEAQVEDINQEMIQSINKENVEPKEEMGRILNFPSV